MTYIKFYIRLKARNIFFLLDRLISHNHHVFFYSILIQVKELMSYVIMKALHSFIYVVFILCWSFVEYLNFEIRFIDQVFILAFLFISSFSLLHHLFPLLILLKPIIFLSNRNFTHLFFFSFIQVFQSLTVAHYFLIGQEVILVELRKIDHHW